MKIEDCGGKYKGCLVLGIQTNITLVESTADWKARMWAPRNAKSFTITELRHTDYHGHTKQKETGFATITVEYFTSSKEGKCKLDDKSRKAEKFLLQVLKENE